MWDRNSYTFQSKGAGAPSFLSFCLHIYFQYNFFISLLFHLFSLISACSCPYSYNLMLTTTYMCRPYIYTYIYILVIHKARNSYTFSLFRRFTHLQIWRKLYLCSLSYPLLLNETGTILSTERGITPMKKYNFRNKSGICKMFYCL